MQEIISILALLISVISVSFTIYVHYENKKNSKQIEEYRKEFYELEIENKTENKFNKNKAKLTTEITQAEGICNYEIRIKNIGESLAEDVTIEIIIERAYLGHFNNTDIFPINIESGASIKIGYVKVINFPNKFELKIRWKDKQGDKNEKTIDLTP